MRSSQVIGGAIVLQPRNVAALTGYLNAVTSQRSPLFHHYLAKGQFGARFGATAATVRSVTSLLRADGLQVTNISANHVLIGFKGTAARIESAFHTGLENYRFADGRVGRGTTSAVRLPGALAAHVITVVGLDDLLHASTSFERLTKPDHAGALPGPSLPKAAAGAPSACAAAAGQRAPYGGITDDQLAYSYGVDGLYTAGDLGAGQTVDIFELEPYANRDIAAFDKCYFAGVSHTSQVTDTLIDGGPGTGEGSGESVLDIEDVSALAPSADIHVFSAPNSTFGSLDAYNAIANADDANQVSTSWGLCESAFAYGAPGTQQAENVIYEQMAAQGQSMFSSAGDDGSDDCAGHASSPVANNLSLDDPASQPYVVSVGGTTFLNTDQPPSEIVWNDGSDWGAGGGGISDTWAEPAWQQGATVPGISSAEAAAGGTDPCSDDPEGTLSDDYHLKGVATTLPPGTPCRLAPDVSGLADEFTGITIFAAEFGGWTTIGGTSSSTPLWAAMTADMNASSFCAHGSGDSLGFVSPLLYEVASEGASDYAASFNNITVGNNDDLDVGPNSTTFSAGTGYNLASGLGTPRITNPTGPGLAELVCTLATYSGIPAVSSLSPASGASGGGTTVVIAGSNFGSSQGLVFIGNEEATVNSWSSSSISITTPSYDPPNGTITPAAGPADVTVVSASPEYSSFPGPNSTFHYAATDGTSPVVDYMSPSGGLSTSTTSTVDIIGSGFTSTTTPTVTFGGQEATNVTAISDSELQVTPPAENGSTACANPSDTSVCQVQVVVTTSGGTSETTNILPAETGPVQFEPSGVLAVEPGVETVPAPTEYDYAPAPTVTSVNPQYSSEFGGNPVDITGTGFNILTYEWATFGDPGVADSDDFNLLSISPTDVEVVALGDTPVVNSGVATPEAVSIPDGVGVSSISGSAGTAASWAGAPTVSSISVHNGSTAGGTAVTVTGTGFTGTDLVGFVAQDPTAPWGASIVNHFDVASDTSITLNSPADLPIATYVLVCTETSCSPASTASAFDYSYAGQPVVTGVKPATGTALGGTKVTISGTLLGNATKVLFGTKAALDFEQPSGLPDITDSTAITAVAPPGTPSTVDIRVFTAGGALVGKAESAATSADHFTYTASSPSAPQSVTASVKSGVVTVNWKAPASTGGAAITKYELLATASGQKSVSETAAGSARSATFKTLKAGITWTITVRAVNSHGTGPAGKVTVKP